MFIDELFAAISGLATTAQLLAVMSRKSLAAHVSAGALVRVWHGVYAMSEPDTITRLAALDLMTGKKMVACMNTAAGLYGFDTEKDGRIHVLDPGVRVRPTAGLMVHQRVGAPLRRIRGRLVTAPACPYRGPWQDHHEWEGWWGNQTPFHTPVFVMTHHQRPSLTLTDTTFHFVSGDPADVLTQAKAAAGGKDVRLGGGASTVRQFLDAGLVDTLHVAVADVEIGAGSRLWESPDELEDRFHHEVVPSPSGVTHHLFWRR